MITLEKEKIATQPTVKVIKRDGRSVNFDADKIYNALLKASNNVTKMSPVIEAKLESISDNIVAEIFDRFKDNVKIYEIQNIVEHELLEANEYAIAQEYINYRTKRDFARSQATDINFSIDKLLNKDQTVVNENANKDSEVFNTQRDLTAGIVGKSIGLKMLPAHVANAHLTLKECWEMALRLVMLKLKVQNLFKQRQLKFLKSLLTSLQANMVDVQQTVSMNFWHHMLNLTIKNI